MNMLHCMPRKLISTTSGRRQDGDVLRPHPRLRRAAAWAVLVLWSVLAGVFPASGQSGATVDTPITSERGFSGANPVPAGSAL